MAKILHRTGEKPLLGGSDVDQKEWRCQPMPDKLCPCLPIVPHLGFLPCLLRTSRPPHTPKYEKAQGLLGRSRESQ